MLLRVFSHMPRFPSLCRVAAFLMPVLALSLMGDVGRAQVPNLSLEQLQLLQRAQQQQQMQQQLPAVPGQPAAVILQPDLVPLRTPLQQSRLEQIMSARVGVQLQQFGYEQFGSGRNVTVPLTGAVQDDYILGAGDEVVVSLRGQENGDTRLVVDRNGQVLMPRLSPIPAAGRTLGAFRRDVEDAVRRAYVATNAFLSLGQVRQISVTVTGEVNNPGPRLVTGLASVVDALLLSGGLKKSGTLRNIRVQRGGREFSVDLYAMLTDQGAATNMRLADGDRIRVPLLGPTVAVTGLVRQPGIYELPPGQRGMPASVLLRLAGGEEVRGVYRLSVLRVSPDGRTQLTELRQRTETIGDSEILFVQIGADQTVSRVTLSGNIGLAGTYPISEDTKLSSILKAPGALGNEPYTLFGLIARRDPATLMRTLSAFTPVAVLSGTEDMVLRNDDIIRIFSVAESRLLIQAVQDYSSSAATQQLALRNPVAASNAKQTAQGQPRGGDAGLSVSDSILSAAKSSASSQETQSQVVQSLATRTASGSESDSQFANRDERVPPPPADITRGQAENFDRRSDEPAASDFLRRTGNGTYPINREAKTLAQVAEQINIEEIVLLTLLSDHQITLSGAVRGPGTYIVGPSARLAELVVAAGGTLNWVDGSNVELTTTTLDPATGRANTHRSRLPLTNELLASYILKPRDEILFQQIFTDTNIGSVVIQGEVRFTGTYSLKRGERLSDLLVRAGGLTNSAYPYGTVFLRKSVAAIERDGYMRTAREIQEQLISGMTRVGTSRIEPAAYASLQTFVSELRNQQALGRISIVADPSVLIARPELDPILEVDDVIYIPQRPSNITVLGQVMQPGSFPYRAGEKIGDYLARAGGYARFADESMTFVVLPDGTARRVERSWLSFDATASNLPPGSAIVVPRDMAPFDLRQSLIDISQIFSQFAVSIASIAVISKQ
jgi:protein involved in polysaccharide export with SLBB domain